uniref:Uncharacterized protein n=1 Tax=Arundo donax TaxID=35708 RepID=A0A0A9C3R6_ARUDO
MEERAPQFVQFAGKRCKIFPSHPFPFSVLLILEAKVVVFCGI